MKNLPVFFKANSHAPPRHNKIWKLVNQF